MALANFFGKNALAAAQVLGGMTPETLSHILDRHIVAIAFDDTAASSTEGRTTVELAVNLAARLYPRLAVLPLGTASMASRKLARTVEELAQAINPDLELTADVARATIAVVVGDTVFPIQAGNRTLVIYAGSSGWYARISTTEPTGSSGSDNPFGAAAAACFALANVFRTVFANHLCAPEPDSGFALSLFDYRHYPATSARGSSLPPSGPDLADFVLDVGETVLGGVGAIGNATVWTLARVPRLSGTLEVVDDQTVGLTNLQRYVLTNQAHASTGTAKVDLAAAILLDAANARSETNLRVVPHPFLWGEYLRRRADFRLERVATAFDTIDARLAVQAALPRRVLNAWTQQGDLGVSRHLAFGQMPCLACIYPQRPGGKSEAELVAEAMVVPEPAMAIRELLYSGAAIGEAFIREVAERRGITTPDKVEPLLRYATRPLREFYQEAFCGGLILQLGGGTDRATVRAEAPVAFQSALAGVMLAAEIVIDAGGLRGVNADAPPARTVIDLLRPLSVHVPVVSRRQDGQCLCEDPDYLSTYAAKYTSAPI